MREEREDMQKAAIEIQRFCFCFHFVRIDNILLLYLRAYRCHLSRIKAIKKRPPALETLEWAKEYKQSLIRKELGRMDKAEGVAKQLVLLDFSFRLALI